MIDHYIFVLFQVSSRSVVVIDWDKIWSFNKKVIDPKAPHFTALFKSQMVKVFVNGQSEIESKKVDKHPKVKYYILSYYIAFDKG